MYLIVTSPSRALFKYLGALGRSMEQGSPLFFRGSSCGSRGSAMQRTLDVVPDPPTKHRFKGGTQKPIPHLRGNYFGGCREPIFEPETVSVCSDLRCPPYAQTDSFLRFSIRVHFCSQTSVPQASSPSGYSFQALKLLHLERFVHHTFQP